jgi:hypothetical protein
LWYNSCHEDVVRCYPAGVDIEPYFTFVFRKYMPSGNSKMATLRMRARQVIIHKANDEFADCFVGELPKSAVEAKQQHQQQPDLVLNEQETHSELDAIAASMSTAAEPVDETTTTAPVAVVVEVAAPAPVASEELQQQRQQQQQPPKKRVKISESSAASTMCFNAPPGLFHE